MHGERFSGYVDPGQDHERGRVAERSSNDPEGLSITQRMAKMSGERAQLADTMAEKTILLNSLVIMMVVEVVDLDEVVVEN